MTRRIARTVALLALVGVAGCGPADKKPAEEPVAKTEPTPVVTVITDTDWNLTGIAERSNPLGNGGKPVTMRLDSATQRAAGNGGCNRYSASYSLRGDSLSFGPGMSTKMACPDGMELEAAWLKTLPLVVTYSATESTLTLNAAAGPVATFHKP